MSLIDETAETAEGDGLPADVDIGSKSGFRFLPRELASKCRKLVESYHAIYGYAALPDMLWLSDARDIIECHSDLTHIFTRASKSRGAKRANASLQLIATLVVSLEVLARDFAGWGRQFPAAKRAAETILGDYPARHARAWLMDLYLYPPRGMRRELVSALAPSASGG